MLHLISTVQATGNIRYVPQGFPYLSVDYLEKFKVLIPFFRVHQNWRSGMKKSTQCFMMKINFDNLLTVCFNIVESLLLAHNCI